MLSQLFTVLVAAASVLGCADHSAESLVLQSSGLHRRADNSQKWAYEASFNWGRLSKNYTICQAGTMQAPIALMKSQGMSLNHIPTFNFKKSISGYLWNWGYGPSFTIDHNSTGSITAGPSMTFDNTTLFLKGWHVHAPADHTVQGDRSKAELHFVMADSKGSEKAVLALRIDPGNTISKFWQQFSDIPYFDNSTTIAMTADMSSALTEVGNFNEFWTYKGSLTSPPCTEGIRFFVAGGVLSVGMLQMQQILAVSTFSARTEQEVWMHEINV